jgi:glycosyltransferase involved in cell wall biosynthesis
MGVAPSRVRVVHHGWSSPGGDVPEGDLDLPDRYILTVADLQPHKNIGTLLRAFNSLAGTGRYPGDLVIVGGQKEMSSGYARHLAGVLRDLPCRDRVHFLGSVPHQMLSQAYRRADLFVFPSLEETFGLPLVEAMGAGVPVVASDWRRAPGGEADRFNVGPEVCGEAADFFDPTSASALADAVARALSDPARRAELARLGRARAKEFSWDKAAAALVTIFEEAAASPQPDRRRP